MNAEALLGSAAFGVSPLALPWGSSACYVQPVVQGRGGRATLVKRPTCTITVPTARQSVVLAEAEGTLQYHFQSYIQVVPTC